MTVGKDIAPRETELLIYQTEDGRTPVDVRFDGETGFHRGYSVKFPPHQERVRVGASFAGALDDDEKK